MDLLALRKVMDTPSFPQKFSQMQIRRVVSLHVAGAVDKRPARLYIPYGKVRGVILFFHGGGFVHGGLNAYHGICCRLALSSHAAVLSVDYRLAPEHPFPAAVEDAEQVWVWLCHVLQQRFPNQKVVVAGDSAGANLAAVIAFKARHAKSDQLAGQLLFYPTLSGAYALPSRFQYAENYMLTKRLMEWYGKMYLTEESCFENVDFAPLLHTDFSGLAPAIIITAQFDPLYDEGRYYAAALHKAGVKVWYRCYGGTIHGFLNFYVFMPKAKKALSYAGQTVRNLLEAADHP
ncbi:alpha/beta hydrolase [Entomobacter blattae]|uniref:Carboxylesterase NlhH n=1 Tax=Entomobacter blattae TaxID=2762277 RepID=A0A7H1NNR0_9PROT|nr:alpha/beta hydrolase [Entomobacter blattae]QNT77420.1 Carboxylesterase NlhH [Entomobacter blattae]